MFNFLKRLFQVNESQDFPVQHPDTWLVDESFPSSYPCGRPFVVVDVETTGLSPEDDDIIQLSAIRFTGDGQSDGAFNTYLNPGRKIPAQASRINGITDRMVAHAPRAGDVSDAFATFCRDRLIVGYNVNFDLRFLRSTFGEPFFHRDYIDVLSLAREFIPSANYKLETVSSSLGIYPTHGFHDSLSDCEATAAVLSHLGKISAPINSSVRYFYGGMTQEERKQRAAAERWEQYSQPFFLQGETARKEGRFEDALCFYDQAKAACDIVYPFLFESYAKVFRKQLDYQSEILVLTEGISRLGAENCPELIERRAKAEQRLQAAMAAKKLEEERAIRRAERAERKLREAEAALKPKKPAGRPVLKLDDDGTVLEEYSSITAAASAAGVDKKGIREAANGKQKRAGGFRWMFKAVETDEDPAPSDTKTPGTRPGA